ncbi:MAG: hypothetical protein M1819_005620 [Sarea resinae]|nr:MAG: hypothetical protein M1819_005620 [Sarea resinae]
MATLRPSSLRGVPRLLKLSPHTIRYTSTHTAGPSSVNPQEVAHFNALASSWWDPHGPSRLLHLMNPLRHDFISSCQASVPAPRDPQPGPKQLRYLDIGCGGGIFTESAARLPSTASVTGIDPSAEVLAVAKSHLRQDPALLSQKKLNYLNTSIEDLPVPQSTQDQCDVVSLFEVIEHTAHPSAFLESCMPFVKPGGWLVLSTISRTWTSWLTTVVVAEEVIRMVPRGTHDWRNYINEDEMRGWFVGRPGWGQPRAMGVMYLPGLGWKKVQGSEQWGNYFFAVRKDEEV